ncbi:MAG: TlpA family protein disulfide reductase [Deltaproteobacteria bacterium]|nr:TlpA family protein disulfide reductase [Deltaproteobacteria bacterium]
MVDNADNEKNLTPIIVAVVAVIVAAVVAFVFMGRDSYKEIEKSSSAIDFVLPDMDGKLRKLGDYKGKVVFLNFWATWCPPCKEEMPSMQVLYDNLKDKNFVIVAVSSDTSADDVKKFIGENKLTFPVLLDPKGKIKEAYKTTGFPETFIIDQNGVVAEKVVGPRNWTDNGNLSVIFDLIKNGPRPRK